jgi:hypothetical protein
MNKGSNPVGVASESKSENAVEQDVSGRQLPVASEQTSPDLTQGRHKEGERAPFASEQTSPDLTQGRHKEEQGAPSAGETPAGNTGEVAAEPSRGPRKRPKAGLCKRRGCKEAVADVVSRLCADHMPQGMGVAPVAEVAEDDTAETHLTDHMAVRGFTGCPPIVGQEVEVFYGTEAEPWRRDTVTAVTADGFVAGGPGGVTYYQREECETWRWPLATTHGKNGGLAAIPEESEQPNDGQPPGVTLAVGDEVRDGKGRVWKVIRVSRHGFGAERREVSADGTEVYGVWSDVWGAQGISWWRAYGAGDFHAPVKVPDDAPPWSGSRRAPGCPECVAARGRAAAPTLSAILAPSLRVCAGIPGVVGEGRCNCVLGDDVPGPRCSRCQAAVAEAEQAQREENDRADRGILESVGLTDLLCANSGCTRAHAIDSRYCEHHRKVAEAVAYVALDHAFEAAWADLLGSHHLDRKTVEVCKALRDKEVSL